MKKFTKKNGRIWRISNALGSSDHFTPGHFFAGWDFFYSLVSRQPCNCNKMIFRKIEPKDIPSC